MVRNLLALLLILGMSTLASADEATGVNFNLTGNDVSVKVTTPNWGYNTQTTATTSGSKFIIDLDCTANETTHEITSINSLDFVSGVLKLMDPVTFNYGVDHVTMDNVYGNFSSSASPATIISSTTVDGINTTTFDASEYSILLDHGTFISDPYDPEEDPVTYDLSTDGSFPCDNTTSEVATLVTEYDSIVGDQYKYNVSLTLPYTCGYWLSSPCDAINRFQITEGATYWTAETSFYLDLPNQAPEAEVDVYYDAVELGDSVTIWSGSGGILDNDTDPDDGPSSMTAVLHTDPDYGKLREFYATGTFTYKATEEPPGGWAKFYYQAFDGEDYSDRTAVYIEVISPQITVPGDTNGDDIVNEIDQQVVADNWGENFTGPENGDFNSDGVVNGKDASILAANWGNHTTESEGNAVPEPSTMILLLAGLISAGLMRRRAI